MVNPQTEDGFTRIANELLEQVPRFRFNGTQLRIILVVWRYTYGFKRKEHPFALNFLAEAIQASRSQVDRELSALIERNVLTVVAESKGKARIIGFNKKYSEWVNERCTRNGGHPGSVLQNADSVSSALGTQVSSALGTKKEKKERSKEKRSSSRNNKPVYSENDRYYQMAAYLHSKIMDHAALNRVDHLVRDAKLQDWADVFRKIVEIDKRNTQELKEVIEWCTSDTFWSTNILSAKKLREKYVELGVKMKAARSGGPERQNQSRAGRNKALLQQKMKEAKHEQGGNAATAVDLFSSLPDGGTD